MVHLRRSRKQFRVLILAVVVAAIAVPLGFALSLEPVPTASTAGPAGDAVLLSTAVNASALLASPGDAPADWGISDGARLFCVGTLLFALAAAVKKAV